MTSRFDPDAAARPGSGPFGLDHSAEDALIHILPVPFDATTSYRDGAAFGPDAILAATHQVELADLQFGQPYRAGLHWLEADPRIAEWNAEAREYAEPIIARGGMIDGDPDMTRALQRVDELGAKVNEHVTERTNAILAAGKRPLIVGGDHSVPYGAICAAAQLHPGLGILHFDAHADLRVAFEGFRWSHASILHNVLEDAHELEALLQVGLRDLGQAEVERIHSDPRVHAVFDHEWAAARLAGLDQVSFVRDRIALLPDTVWVTFDVDGLDPVLCPGTGTPVPGGLDWNEAALWLKTLADSGRTVVGADLVEVRPGDSGDAEDSWDAIVGARLLYRLAALLAGPGSR
jgi:agmatinase